MAPTFDPGKDRENRRKHGVSLARFADLTRRYAIYSPRAGEDRWIVLGFLDGTLHTGIMTRRDGDVRPISLRRASRHERQEYARVYPD
jgi:uncharacterized DUF497 family protein